MPEPKSSKPLVAGAGCAALVFAPFVGLGVGTYWAQDCFNEAAGCDGGVCAACIVFVPAGAVLATLAVLVVALIAFVATPDSRPR